MSKPSRACPSCSSQHTLQIGSVHVQRCSVCDYVWRPCSDPFCMGFRIVNLDTDPAIRGCAYCDLERGGISDDTARSFSAARRAFWRAHDELDKVRAEQDAALVHALVRSYAHGTRDGVEADDDDDDADDADDADDDDDAPAASHSTRRPGTLPPRRSSGAGSSSRRIRFRRA